MYSWKLSRTRALTAAAATAINAVVSTVPVLDDRYYIVRNHTEDGCFYYPEPSSDTAVFFRGQCSDSVTVVQNFDVAAVSFYFAGGDVNDTDIVSVCLLLRKEKKTCVRSCSSEIWYG